MLSSKSGNQLVRQILILLAGLLPLSGLARAQDVLVSGNALGGSDPAFTGALTSIGVNPTFVSASDYGTVSLAGFKAVWLDGFSQFSPGTAGNPGLSATALVNFMTGGGVVLVQNPGFGSESMTAFPFGSELSAVFTTPPGENTVRLTGSLSPVNAHLTSAGLSGWNPSAYGIFTSAGSFTALSDNGTDGNYLTLVRPVGSGLLVYTQQGIGQRLSADPTDPQALQFLGNVFAQAVVPEPSTIALWSIGVGALLVVLRRAPAR